MKRVNKEILAVLVAFAIVIGMLCNFKIDSNAQAPYINCDMSKKTITLNVRPYEGISKADAFPSDWTLYFANIAIKTSQTKVVDKSNGSEIGNDEHLVAGKTYHYSVIIESVENQSKPHAAVDISQYSINIKNNVILSDSSSFSNISISAGTYTRTFECDITVKGEPNYNLGTLNVDFKKDNATMYASDSRLVYVVEYLYNENAKNNINYIDSSNDSCDFDLDKDGKYDLRFSFDGDYYLKKLGTCSLTKPISFSMTQQQRTQKESEYGAYYSTIIFDFTKNSSNNNNNNSSGNNSNSGSNKSSKGSSYKNEWVKGQWYDANGGTSYTAKGSWKSNSKGWWFEDSKGWYPHSQWQKIDGKWYYFTADGYMDYSEYRDGYWLGADGAWDENYSHGKWHLDGTGWWYEDNGWYPHNQYLWIDGVKYWFNSSGYMS